MLFVITLIDAHRRWRVTSFPLPIFVMGSYVFMVHCIYLSVRVHIGAGEHGDVFTPADGKEI